MPSGSHRLRVATLLAALLGGGSMIAARPAWSADDAARGAERFGQLCASCHGRDGAGFGPVADSLKHAPPDLRRIAERRGGKFPEAEVAACIDGRRGCAPHGIREMPVWGSWGLRALAEDGELTPAMAELLAFLSSIQVKPAAK
jgi:mono/diheme cytochrome c family protein